MYIPFKPVSVKAYYITLRAGRKLTCAEEARQVGDLCAMGIIRNAGIKTTIELWRASGMGLYNIYDALQYSNLPNKDIDLDRVRDLCEHFDRTLHEAW